MKNPFTIAPPDDSPEQLAATRHRLAVLVDRAETDLTDDADPRTVLDTLLSALDALISELHARKVTRP